ncbi:MAG: GAF domain-containing protein [Ignavibacterium sp.]
MGTEFPEINEDDTFLDADFIYESQPDIVEEIQEISDEPLTESETEIENNIPVEDELNTILEEKVSLKNFNLILNQISANQNLDLTVQSILKNFLQLTGSDRGLIFLYDEKKSELIPEFNICGKSEIPSVKLSEGITGKAAAAKKLFFISNP